MANHCLNTITISNFENPEDFTKLQTKINNLLDIEHTELLLLAVTKKELNKLWDKGLLELSEKLGTKWLSYNDIQTDIDDYIEIEADSAWAPPTGWGLIISKKYNCTVKIKYDEPGMQFMGIYIASKGKKLKDNSIEY